MLFDDRALVTLDRKRTRLRAIEGTRKYDRWISELPRLFEWILSVPVLAAYVRQIVHQHEKARRECARFVDDAVQEMTRLSADLRAAPVTSGDRVAPYPSVIGRPVPA